MWVWLQVRPFLVERDDLALSLADRRLSAQGAQHRWIASYVAGDSCPPLAPFDEFEFTPYIELPARLECFQKPFRDFQETVVERCLPLTAFFLQHHDGAGWGLHTLLPLSAGQVVGVYAGTLVSTREARQLYREVYDAQHLNYALGVREAGADFVLATTVDATAKGNLTRFINHSCRPNLRIELARPHAGAADETAGALQLLALPVFVATQRVAAGDELAFHYGDGLSSGAGGRPCLCGHRCCSGFLPANAL